MTTSDPEDGPQSHSGAADPIGPFQSKRRAQTFDTGSEPKKTLQGILRKKVLQKKSNFKYEPISYHDEIRILKILRGPKNSPLQCMLFRSALPSTVHPSRSKLAAHPYWALSYWWGEDKPTHPIQIFDDTGVRKGLLRMTPFNPSGTFYVRSNLAAALQQFRSETDDISVWVDALCINQEDLTEKNAQVARMHEIYNEAEYVCVWLGAGKPDTHETFKFLRSILDLQHFDELVKKTREDPKEWMLIVNLMKNRWFSRRWVIQELALARKATVFWGDEKISWQDFSDAIALFMTKHDEIKDMLENKRSFEVMSDPDAYIGGMEPRALGANTLVHATSTLFRKSDDGRIQQRLLSLEVLVSSLFLAFEASEPRDTVYAVLSLAKDTAVQVDLVDPPSWLIPPKHNMVIHILCGFFYFYFCLILQRLVSWRWSENDDDCNDSPIQQSKYSVCVDDRITPDYDKSLTDVCADFMEYCIEKSRSLDILCRHWAPRPKKLDALERLQMEKNREKEEKEMPTWIPSIEGHAYGGPLGRLRGRSNGDSFVGDHVRYNQQYNASGGLPPCVQFGKYEPRRLQSNNTPDKQRPAPNKNQSVDLESVPVVAAQAKEQSELRMEKFDGTLLVKGFRIDSIERLSGRALDGVIPSLALEWGGWPKSDDGPPPVEVPDKLWRTLVADRDPDGNNAPPWYRRACLECLQHVNPSGDLNTKQFKNVEHTPASMKMFIERVRAVVWRRQFFITRGKKERGKKPLYGLAPPETREGDIICILFGCSVPVVLRKVPPLDRYTFVGECYVHGMMDGETLPEQNLAHPYSNVKNFTLV